MGPQEEKILFVRLDKIGDLCLTLPCQDHPDLKPMGLKPLWLIQKATEFIVEQASFDNRPDYLTLDFSVSSQRIWQQLSALQRKLKELKVQHLVIFQAPRWFYVWAWWQGYDFRSGRISHPIHRGALNEGVRQSRKSGDISELQYNWELLSLSFKRLRSLKKFHDLSKKLFVSAGRSSPKGLTLKAKPLRHLLEKFDLSPKDYLVIHPGMAGSAPNWPISSYCKLIENLSSRIQIVITGTRSDDRYLIPLKAELKSNTKLLWLDGKLSPQELLYLLSQAKCVLAPSTGVLHLAAAVQTKCLGLYANEAAFHPLRWGPYTSTRALEKTEDLQFLNSERIKILISEKEKRKKLDDLDDLPVDAVNKALLELCFSEK